MSGTPPAAIDLIAHYTFKNKNDPGNPSPENARVRKAKFQKKKIFNCQVNNNQKPALYLVLELPGQEA